MNISRRTFLGGLTAAAASPLFAMHESDYDETLVALLSDTHIPGTNASEYQRHEMMKTVADVLKLRPLPKNLIIFGDFAYLVGLKDDYAMAKKLIEPLVSAGIQITIAMGNHDRRGPFLDLFPEYEKTTKVPGRIVSIAATPHADFIMLDTCQEGPVEGKLSDEQHVWLAETLKDYPKPVFVGSHHPLEEIGIDKMLTNSPAVAGYIHGHDHRWLKTWVKRDWSSPYRLRTLCLPSTGHWGDIGYTLLRLQPDRCVAELRQRDFFFPKPAAKPHDAPPEWSILMEENKNQTCTFLFPKKSV